MATFKGNLGTKREEKGYHRASKKDHLMPSKRDILDVSGVAWEAFREAQFEGFGELNSILQLSKTQSLAQREPETEAYSHKRMRTRAHTHRHSLSLSLSLCMFSYSSSGRDGQVGLLLSLCLSLSLSLSLSRYLYLYLYLNLYLCLYLRLSLSSSLSLSLSLSRSLSLSLWCLPVQYLVLGKYVLLKQSNCLTIARTFLRCSQQAVGWRCNRVFHGASDHADYATARKHSMFNVRNSRSPIVPNPGSCQGTCNKLP